MPPTSGIPRNARRKTAMAMASDGRTNQRPARSSIVGDRSRPSLTVISTPKMPMVASEYEIA